MTLSDSMTLDNLVLDILHAEDENQWLARILDSLHAFEAVDLLTRLRAEAERYLVINAHDAQRLAEAVIVAADHLERPTHRALGIMTKADARWMLGHYQQAVQLYEEARQAFLDQRDEVGWARTHIGWVMASHHLGRGAEALEALRPAYAVLIRHQEWTRAARMDNSAGYVSFFLGRYEQALMFYARAQRIWESPEATDEVLAARAKANRAEVLALLGDFQTGLALHQAARDIFVRHGETVSVLREDQYIADAYAAQGDYSRALHLYAEAANALDQAGLAVDAAWVGLSMVECYLNLNHNGEALELAEETATRFERHGTPTETARARFACALAHARLGERERALTLLSEVAQAFTDTGLSGQLGLVTLQRAQLFLSEEDWHSALREAERARGLLAQHGLVVRQAQAELVQARALIGLGGYQVAADLARSALKILDERDVLGLAHEGHHLLATVARAGGDLEGALVEYQAAMNVIDQVQSRLAVQLRGDFLEDKLQVYHGAVDCCRQLARPELAFEYLERAKSRALVDYLISHPDVRPRAPGAAERALGDELARLREEHNWLYNRLYGDGLGRRPQDGPPESESISLPEAEVKALASALHDREKQIARILERLTLHEAAGREELIAVPAGMDRARPALDQQTVLLEYYFHEDRGAVFVLAGDTLEVVPLAVPLSTVRRLLDGWQLNIAATAHAVATSRRLDNLARRARQILEDLYQALLQPLAPHLSGRERLIVVPHGPTHAVPFHALHDGQRYLLESIEVVACPSSRLLRHCLERPRRTGHSALVVAYSDGGRLPFVLEEARVVSALFPGACYIEAEATREAVVKMTPGQSVLHLATHGEARLDNPTFAHLKLADGQLSAADVFNLELDGALVVLSACETGRSVVTGGDELIGLSRGFLYAGAATLVQSLWRVEDRATAELMEHFYRALRAGRPKGAALREAQLALLASHGIHPYFWAAFQLIGDSGALPATGGLDA